MKTKPTVDELTEAIERFTGSEEFYRHPIGEFIYTEGVRYIAETCGAYWLLDLIGSHQIGIQRRHGEQAFQCWRLVPPPSFAEKACIAECHSDCEDDGTFSDAHLLARQRIDYTDFPLAVNLKLYFENNTLMLPGER